jgi:amidase
MNIDEYVRYDATGLADEIRAGRVGADEVMLAAKAAAARVNPELNAIIETFDEPLEYAADGPFAGVPFLVKDLVLHAGGIANDSGSRLLAGRYVPPADSELMTRFRRAGFATFGRTTTPEFGFNATTESVLHGPTRNPWNPAYSAGGSSGGSAAAVAAGIVPAAHANDGGGSIRIPAAACGLVGLKPSRGRTPVGPDYNLPLFGLGIEFAVTRTVRDSAAILDAVEGPEPGAMFDIGRPPVRYAEAIRTPARRLRVAVAMRFPGAGVTHPDCVAATEHVARTLEHLGHDVDVATPAYDAEALASASFTAWTAFLASDALGAAEALGRPYDPRDVEACTHACIEHGRALSGRDLQRMLMQFNGVSRAVGGFFGRYDLLVTPVMRMPTVELGYLDQNDATLDARGWCDKVFDYCPFTGLFNVTGTPAISLPAGWSGDRPVGVQLAGPMGSEAVLLQVAAALEQMVGWYTRRPRVHAAGG